MPITTTRSTPLDAQRSFIASHSDINESGVCVGRCFQPKKSFPAPVSLSSTSKAERAFSTYSLYSASFTKELHPPAFTLIIAVNFFCVAKLVFLFKFCIFISSNVRNCLNFIQKFFYGSFWSDFPDFFQSDDSAVLFKKSEKSLSKIPHKIYNDKNLNSFLKESSKRYEQKVQP